MLALSAAFAFTGTAVSFADDKIKLRMSYSGSKTDQRSVAFEEVFAPAVADFAEYKPSYNSSLFDQGTELEAMARGNLELTFASAQELAQYIPEFSIFTAGYVHQNADHQLAVFAAPLMDDFKKKVEETLKVKLLSVIYLGRRQLNLRPSKDELMVKTPADLKGVNLRMPGTDSWQFLGKALGASPTPMAFAEVYTGLQSGAIDGQDNPLPTTVDKKFYEVTKQIVLTSHLVDLNYAAISLKTWNALSADQQKTLEKAATDAAALGRKNQLAQEGELVDFLKKQGLEVYEPDVAAFRNAVQAAYKDSDFAKSWPEGVLDKINALGK
jgi:TRAP-type C4-dicarboxylate transport system substrate-binding protein